MQDLYETLEEPMPRVVVVLARCSRREASFGMRLEETLPDQWVVDWAFPVREAAARREGYDRAVIQGVFILGKTYPGCPHCEWRDFVRCGCGRVGCYDGQNPSYTCPWCGRAGRVGTGAGASADWKRAETYERQRD